jgi:hypothetical protein
VEDVRGEAHRRELGDDIFDELLELGRVSEWCERSRHSRLVDATTSST